MKKSHDRAYKQLFSRKEIAVQLLEYFVYEDFVKYLDFNTLEKTNKTYIRTKYKNRE